MSEKEIIQNATLHVIRPQKYQMAFWGLVILIGGIAIGSATTVMVMKRGPQHPMPGMEGSAQRMVQGMARELNLTPEQQRLIEPLIKQHMAKLNDIRSKAQPQITEQFKLMHDETAKILTPQQLLLWEARLKRIPEDFRPPMLPRDRRGPNPFQTLPQRQGPVRQPGAPIRPDGQPRDSQPQQPQPVGPPPGAVMNQNPQMQEDRLAAAVFDEGPAQAQNVQQDAAQAQPTSQPPQPDQQDDMMPPPPPDDNGGPAAQEGEPGGQPMGPPPD